jgi:hypothetical protein
MPISSQTARGSLYERSATRPLCHRAAKSGRPLRHHDLLVPASLDQRDAHGGRGRAPGCPDSGNIGGDDRAGLRAFPQSVLPGCPSQARQGESNTRALTSLASSERTIAFPPWRSRGMPLFARSKPVRRSPPSGGMPRALAEPVPTPAEERTYCLSGKFRL